MSSAPQRERERERERERGRERERLRERARERARARGRVVERERESVGSERGRTKPALQRSTQGLRRSRAAKQV